MTAMDGELKGRASEVETKSRGKRAVKEAGRRLKQAQLASVLLKHASDATRLHVILILSGGEQNVGQLCELLGLGQPAVSHHLALMRHGGVITPRRQGKSNYYGLAEKGEALLRVVKTLMG